MPVNISLALDGITVGIQADETVRIPEGLLLNGSRIALDLPFEPARFYRHGWQSWSLTVWQDPGEHIPRPKPALLLPMQTDPKYACDDRPNGAWVGAVELPDGRILLLGALGMGSHVALEGRWFSGWSEAGPVRWLVAIGSEPDVFRRYASMLRETFGRGRAGEPPRVWCSWYSLYTAIDERILRRVINQVSGMPFEVFQVDDGWQAAIGDWEANAKFPSGMTALAARIQKPGSFPACGWRPCSPFPRHACTGNTLSGC